MTWEKEVEAKVYEQSDSDGTKESSGGAPQGHSNANSKLQEDVKFPMDLRLMHESKDVRFAELDQLLDTAPSISSQQALDDTPRFTFFAADMLSVIRAPELGMLLGKQKHRSFSTFFNASTNGAWWLDCANVSEFELRVLARTFDMHPLSVEIIRSGDLRETFSMFQNYYFVVYNTFVGEDHRPVSLYIAVFRDGLITFHDSPVVACENVRLRMLKLKGAVKKVSSDWICYALMDDIADAFTPVNSEIEGEAAYVEHAVFVENGTAAIALLLGRLGQARQKTMSMLRQLSNKPNVIKEFSARATGDMTLYLGDLETHVNTLKENLMSYENMLSRSHHSYMAILQVQFVNSNTRMTTLLSQVTIVATVLVPMNLVFGAWGMNVPVPGGNATGLGWFFGIVGVVCFVVIVLGACSAWYFRRITRAGPVHILRKSA